MRGGMRNPMPEQPADVRNKNFKEVALGYDMKTAVDEAERCLHCPKPLCVSGCPVNVEIPAFIQAVKEGNMQEAIKILKRKNSLPAVCGRVCPQEKPVRIQNACSALRVSLSLSAVWKRFVADYAREHGLDNVDNEKSCS